LKEGGRAVTKAFVMAASMVALKGAVMAASTVGGRGIRMAAMKASHKVARWVAW
jgi:hypothetical protein